MRKKQIKISDKLMRIIGENKDLGNKLHSHYIYNCDAKEQTEAKQKIDKLIEKYTDKDFLKLSYNNTTRQLILELMELKEEPHWQEIVRRMLRGLSHLLERELARAKKILKPDKIRKKIIEKLKKLHIYEASDVIEVNEKKELVKVHYLSLKHSPLYDEKKKSYDNKFEPWRDTEIIFELNFKKNLFIWKYINIHEKFRGKGVGTKMIILAEELAKELGFTRYTVEYPNRDFWKKMEYIVHEKCDVGIGYSHEAYKEMK